MLLSLRVRLARILYLLALVFRPKPYVVYSTPRDFKRLLLRKHNQRRERGNVLRYLGRRSGRYHATS